MIQLSASTGVEPKDPTHSFRLRKLPPTVDAASCVESPWKVRSEATDWLRPTAAGFPGQSLQQTSTA